MEFFNFVKRFTILEKWYSSLFVVSILGGVFYGLVDTNYYKCCEDYIGVPEKGTNPIEIFSNNYFLGIVEMFTAGLFSIYLNFHTFSTTSSYLYTQGQIFFLPIIFLLAIFELAGSIILGLVGLGFLEVKLLKIKSKLDRKTLFLIGTLLIFIGAVVEYFLISL